MTQSGMSNAVKAVVSTVLTIAVLVVVFGVIFPQVADYGQAWDAIRAMSGAAVLVLVGTVLFNLVVYTWPYPAALPDLRFSDAFSVRQTGFMMSNGIPGIGGALGIGVQYQMLASYGTSPGAAASVVGITSTWNSLITLALPVLGVVALVISGAVTGGAVVAALIGLVVVALAVWLLAVVLGSEGGARRIGTFAQRLAGPAVRRVRKGQDVDLVTPMLSFRLSIVDIVRVRWIPITVSNVGMQLSSFLVLFVALRAIQADAPDAQVTLAQCFAAFTFARLGGFIPITPGGLGIVDLILTSTLVAFGSSSEDALAATLVWRAGTFFPQMFLGMATFLVWRVRSRRTGESGRSG